MTTSATLPAAVRARDREQVRAILAAGPVVQEDLDKGLAHAAWYGGAAPEVLAVRKELFDLLLARGANPNALYGTYGPIIFGTGECLSVQGLQWLLAAGADVSFPPVDTKYGRQCALSYWLGTYARGMNPEKHRGIELLLAAGCYQPPEVTPEILAIHRGDIPALAALLDADPSLAQKHYPDMPYGNAPLLGGTLLHCAVEFGELACIQLLLQRGAEVDARTAARDTPLWLVCRSESPAADRLAIAQLLLAAGANPRYECSAKTTPLHQAAKRGPLAMVELLLRHGAREWQADAEGRKPLDYARDGEAPDRDQIAELLDRPVIRDPNFKAAVRLIHAGDAPALGDLLRAHPSLIHDRALEPDCYIPGYFSNPKLLWFIANNPNLVPNMPPNTLEVAAVLLDAGPEQDDLNYTLGLVMTSLPARQQGLQRPLIRLLLARGAQVTSPDLLSTLAHRELDAVLALLESGFPLTATIAAALGRTADLPPLLAAADAAEKHAALSVAVINDQFEAARLCLDAGADPNRFLSAHTHSTPAHQAAINDNVPVLTLLVQRGAKLDVRDTLWNGTPLGWAIHEGKRAAERYLRSLQSPTPEPLPESTIAAFLQAATPAPEIDHKSGSLDLAQTLATAHPDLAASSFLAACVLGDSGAIAHWLKKDRTLATRPGGPRGWLPLLYLCFSRFLRFQKDRSAAFVRAAQLLLDAGADPNSFWTIPSNPDYREAALYGAAGIANSAPLAQLLLDAGADPSDSESLYHAAEFTDNAALAVLLAARPRRDWVSYCMCHKMDMEDPPGVALFIAHGADVNARLEQGLFKGHRPLHFAIFRRRSPAVFELLLQAGADPDQAGDDGVTPYQLARRMGQRDIAELMRQHGAKSELDSHGQLLSALSEGDAAAMQAMMARDPAILKTLTPLDHHLLVDAANAGNVAAVRLMLDTGFPIATRGASFGGWNGTALDQAAWIGQVEVVRHLLDRGADPTLKHGFGGDALSAAIHGSIHAGHANGPQIAELIARRYPRDKLPAHIAYAQAEGQTALVERLKRVLAESAK